jgi:hypothetical protein
MLTGRRRARLIRIAAIVLLVAVVPGALYIGHWPFFPGYQQTGTTAEAHAHAGHCHTGPSKCSDGPAFGAAAIVTPGVAAVATLGLLLLMWGRPLTEAGDHLSDRIKKPPRRTFAISAS